MPGRIRSKVVRNFGGRKKAVKAVASGRRAVGQAKKGQYAAASISGIKSVRAAQGTKAGKMAKKAVARRMRR